jgi:hypothetical protein
MFPRYWKKDTIEVGMGYLCKDNILFMTWATNDAETEW